MSTVYDAKSLDEISIHFILCTERTGSSLLCLMLNLHPEIISPSEEPFALYLHPKYHKIVAWTEEDIASYVNDFFLLAEKNMDLYFTQRAIFHAELLANKDLLTYERIVKISYLNFYESDQKNKSSVRVIVDKQIKYVYHLEAIQHLFPSAKFLLLVRDVRDNIVSKSIRKLNWNKHPFFLASIWKGAYSRMLVLPENKRLIIKFEDLIRSNETALQKICTFLSLEYDSKMKETNGVFENYVRSQKEKLDPAFTEKLLAFHSGIRSPLDSKKIGQYKAFLSQKEQSIIEGQCQNQLKSFSYEDIAEKKSSSIRFSAYQFLAFLYRPFLLKLYLQLPLGLKLKLKKGRNRRKSIPV
ncbi:MAG: sulfotransferase [Flavobacteriia bacterium]|nr:sulfotransferase [Flavobacteriia bacterium]